MTFDRIAAAMATALPVELTEDVRKKIRINRFNQRMSGYGQSFLDELKADAVIEYQ